MGNVIKGNFGSSLNSEELICENSIALMHQMVDGIYELGYFPEDVDTLECDMNVLFNLLIATIHRIEKKQHFLHSTLDILNQVLEKKTNDNI